MKSSYTLLAALLLPTTIFAHTFYDQLCEFNFNWKKYSGRLQEEKAREFVSDQEYVKAHLESVLKILRSNTVTHLTCEQYEMRVKLVSLLEKYRSLGNFPLNYYCSNRIPVFIDENNTYCAVGYLLRETGYDEVAKCIASTDNYVWVKDIKHPDLPEWQKASGLSMEEIMLIQGAYDIYPINGLFLENKYEVPQKPEIFVKYFDEEKKNTGDEKNIWLKGEGKNGKLNGKWVQNYAYGIPWIVGYYENGKRTGQWEEYYQGTDKLCRTENWRDDKLNGIRKRFDKDGKVIEVIHFKDGEAITKTNYDFTDSVYHVRRPIDSSLVYTEVYTFGGALLASGNESVYNPGGLKWFQNIELTALNSMMVQPEYTGNSVGNNPFEFYTGNDPYILRSQGASLFQTPPLVEYKKQGVWKYYKDYRYEKSKNMPESKPEEILARHYYHYGKELFNLISFYDALKLSQPYDSIKVEYKNNQLESFFGYESNDYTHIGVKYHENPVYQFKDGAESYRFYFNVYSLEAVYLKRETGAYNKLHQKIGVWKHYDESGRLYKKEEFIIPKDEDMSVN